MATLQFGPPNMAREIFAMISGLGDTFEGSFGRARERRTGDELADQVRRLALEQSSPAAALLSAAQPAQARLPSIAAAEGTSPRINVGSIDPVAAGLTPQEAALLNGIAIGESRNRYNVRYTPQGGAEFAGFERHPGIPEPGPHGPSTAAGRYQFTRTTWDRLGGGAFTPERQDQMALRLAREDYRSRTGRDLDADLATEGFSPRIQEALAPTWAALASNQSRNTGAYNATLRRLAAQQPGQTFEPTPVPAGAQPMELAADVPAAGAAPTEFFVPPGPQSRGAELVQMAQASPTGLPAAIAAPTGRAFTPAQAELLAALARNPQTRATAAQLLLGRSGGSDRFSVVGEGGRLFRIDRQTGAVEAVPTGAGAGFRPMTPEERRAFGANDDIPAFIGPDGKPQFGPAAARTNITLPRSEAAYDTNVAKYYADLFTESQTQGRDARRVRTTLGFMRRLIDNPSFYSGFGGDVAKQANRALVAIGVQNPNAAGPAEVFDALAKEVTLGKLGGRLGAGVSNTDVQFISTIAPTLSNTREGNKLLIDYTDRLMQRQQRVSQMARDYAKKFGRLDADFDAMLADWAEKNPVFMERDLAIAQGAGVPAEPAQAAPTVGPTAREPRTTQTREPPTYLPPGLPPGMPPPPVTQEVYDRLPRGTRYMHPDGNWRIKQ